MIVELPSRVRYAGIIVGCTNKREAVRYARRLNAAGFSTMFLPTKTGRGACLVVRGARFSVETMPTLRVTLIPRRAR